MSVAADILRQFWLPGMNEVAGRVTGGLAPWLSKGTYQIYSPIAEDAFTITSADPKGVLPAFAADATRLASAAFESWHAILRNRELPRSTGWFVIKAYYGAFFAAHSMTRMLGESVTLVDRSTADMIFGVADLFGMAGVPTIQAGLYHCTYDSRLGLLSCKNPSSGGSHERFWAVFVGLLARLSRRILEEGTGLTGARQEVAGKLDEICVNLNDNGRLRGTWLSVVRNRVNYRHELGSWFPYSSESKTYYDALFAVAPCWKDDPMTIELALGAGRELQRFLLTCGVILALCRSLVCDMERRCPRGRSFQSYGAAALLNLIGGAEN